MTTKVTSYLGGTLPGANIFASTEAGVNLFGGFYTSTDVNGYAEIATDTPFVTFSYVGHAPRTFAGNNVPSVVELQAAEGVNLDGVTISADAGQPFNWALAITIAAGLIVVIGTAYILKPSLFKF